VNARVCRHPAQQQQVALLEHQPQFLTVQATGLVKAVIEIRMHAVVIPNRTLHLILDVCPRATTCLCADDFTLAEPAREQSDA
jgi:DNA-directed RNA polymerase subunit F